MIQRRQFLTPGLSVGVVSSLSFLAASGAWAQNAPTLGTPTLPAEGHPAQVANFVAAIEGGEPLLVDGIQGRRTLERVFELDVGFDAPPGRRLPFGQRVHLRFEHPPEPLAAQTWRAIRRLFLRHFDV